MAGFTDTLRGDRLARAQRALARSAGDSPRLDRERQPFSHSPPPCTSNPSGTTTRSASPNPLSEEQRRREERRMQLVGEREASKPARQFSAQVEEERRRIWNTDPSTSWRQITPSYACIFKEEAREIVKKRWIEQGIWDNRGTYYTVGRWKHEDEPLESELESETESEAGPPSFLPKPKLRRAKSDDEKRLIAERRVIREREREASRPYYQFVYQISKERELIHEESANGEGAGAADINTRAYENVKNTWTKRGIWNKKWGTLPGMSWKHEEPLEEEAADSPIHTSETALRNAQPSISHGAGNTPFTPLATDLFGAPTSETTGLFRAPTSEATGLFGAHTSETMFRNAHPSISHRAGNAPSTPLYTGLFGTHTSEKAFWNSQPSISHGAGNAPSTSLFGPPPVESNHRQASCALNSSQQGPATETDLDGLENSYLFVHHTAPKAPIDSAGLEKSNAERSPSAPNSPRHRTG